MGKGVWMGKGEGRGREAEVCWQKLVSGDVWVWGRRSEGGRPSGERKCWWRGVERWWGGRKWAGWGWGEGRGGGAMGGVVWEEGVGWVAAGVGWRRVRRVQREGGRGGWGGWEVGCGGGVGVVGGEGRGCGWGGVRCGGGGGGGGGRGWGGSVGAGKGWKRRMEGWGDEKERGGGGGGGSGGIDGLAVGGHIRGSLKIEGRYRRLLAAWALSCGQGCVGMGGGGGLPRVFEGEGCMG